MFGNNSKPHKPCYRVLQLRMIKNGKFDCTGESCLQYHKPHSLLFAVVSHLCAGLYLHQTVAVKVMDFKLGGKDTEKLIKDLQNEFEIMTMVRSQHVVNLMGIVAETRIAMVVEFCWRGDRKSVVWGKVGS